MIFFMSVASGTQKRVVEALNYPYVLVNFMTKCNNPPTCSKTLFVDSGGFPSSFLYNGYNRSDDEYLYFVKKSNAAYFALRDYPCEPQILKKYDVTAKDQILRTVNHHIKLLDLIEDFDISAKPVPVIQGWEIDDYLFCIDIFREHGLIENGFDYVAIGSLCRRHAIHQIRKIILTVRNELRSSIKLHCFGTKISVLKDLAVWRAVYSVDSGAWDFDARWKRYRNQINKSTFETSLILAKRYLDKIERLKKKFEGQKKLYDILETEVGAGVNDI